MQAGAFGQVIMLVILAGCGPAQQRFVGPVTATQGDCGFGFEGGKATGTLSIRGKDALFAPTEGVVVLPGQVDASGHVQAGSSSAGADKKQFVQAFVGEVKGDSVSGTFATPRCRASVVMTRY